MSTICWLPSSGSAPVTITPSAATWDGHINTVTRPLNFVRGGSAFASLAYAPDGADHLADVSTLIAYYVSQILPPQTIAAQQIGFGGRWLESNALNNQFPMWQVSGFSVDGTSNLGIIRAATKGNVEFSTALTGGGEIALSTARTFNVPWRLVLEVGADGLPTTGGGRHNFTFEEGDPFATGNIQLIQSGDTGQAPPLLIFSNDIITNFTPMVGARTGI
jgi:hypothetical protein